MQGTHNISVSHIVLSHSPTMHFENGLQRQPNIQTLLVNRDFMLIFQSAVLKMYKF